MQAKYLIIIAIIGIVALLAFNLFSSSPEPVVTANTEVASTEIINTDTASSTKTDAANSNIADQPLAQQPKAMLDKAQAQADNVQQLEQDKAAQIEAQTAQ